MSKKDSIKENSNELQKDTRDNVSKKVVKENKTNKVQNSSNNKPKTSNSVKAEVKDKPEKKINNSNHNKNNIQKDIKKNSPKSYSADKSKIEVIQPKNNTKNVKISENIESTKKNVVKNGNKTNVIKAEEKQEQHGKAKKEVGQKEAKIQKTAKSDQNVAEKNISEKRVEKKVENLSNTENVNKASNQTIKKSDIIEADTKTEMNIFEKVHGKMAVFHTFFALVIIFIALIVFIIAGFTITQMSDSKIKKGVSINNVNVSGLSKEEAKEKLEKELLNNLGENITFKYNNYTYVVSLNDIKAHLDIDAAVDTAYSMGRKGNVFLNDFDVVKLWFTKTNVNMGVAYDNDLLTSCFNDISARLPEQVVQPSYYVDGDKLIVTSGKPGPTVDIDKAKECILYAIESNNYSNIEYELPIKTKEPDPIDIDKIASEVVREPKDAYYTVEPRMVYPHEYGIQLKQSIDEIKTMLNEPKDEYEIGLNLIRPNVTVNDIGQEAFPDMLSTFSTNYAASNVNRTTNLELASNKIDGVVIMPGETFSYNKTVGERSIEAGYKNAAVFENGQVVDGLGGGICQISSTLYNTVLYADLEIVERNNHTFLTSYLPGGRDATVVYGVLDFQFKNNRSYPIKIASSVAGGVATISIYGLRTENDCEIEISQVKTQSLPYSTEYVSKPGYASGSLVQGGANGSIYEAYITKTRNGEVVYSGLLSRDTYSPMSRMIAR